MALHVVGLFCEDIREEKSGQVSLVGIFPDNIKTANPASPARSPTESAVRFIPKLAIYVRIRIGVDDEVKALKLKLRLPNGEEIPLGDVDPSVIRTAQAQAKNTGIDFAGLVSSASFIGLHLPGLGKVLAILESDTEQQEFAVFNLVE